MAKILITETIHEVGINYLKAAGHQLVFADRDMDVIRWEIQDCDAVVVRIVDLPRELLETARALKIISKHGVGVDNIDLEYCKSRGIAVTITPNANALSVAEHAFALMMALSKNLIPVSEEYREKGFSAKNHAPGVELTGKTLGVIGAGHIGMQLIHMCQKGFGMNVIVYDPYLTEVPEGVEQSPTLEKLLQEADFVSLHCVLNDETRKMIDRKRLGEMKPSAFLINCARGPIVDEEALIEALQSGKIAGAGLDVTDPEPLDADSPLFQMENVIVTPHYAPTTLEASIRVSRIAAENAHAYLSGREPVGRIV